MKDEDIEIFNPSSWTEDQLAKIPLFDLAALISGGGAAIHPGGLSATKQLFENMHMRSDDYVLEIGCGSGKDLCDLVRKCGCRAVGLDNSDFMLKLARRKVLESALRNRIRIVKGYVTNLEFNDNEFDAIFAQSVLEVVSDKHKAASEISRVLKRGGRFGDIEFTWLLEPDIQLAKKLEERIGSKFEPLSSEEWIRLFAEVGLKQTYISLYDELGIPTGFFDLIKHEGLLQALKLQMLFLKWGRLMEHVKKRFEHIRWMESGKLAYGIYVFEKV